MARGSIARITSRAFMGDSNTSGRWSHVGFIHAASSSIRSIRHAVTSSPLKSLIRSLLSRCGIQNLSDTCQWCFLRCKLPGVSPSTHVVTRPEPVRGRFLPRANGLIRNRPALWNLRILLFGKTLSWLIIPRASVKWTSMCRIDNLTMDRPLTRAVDGCVGCCWTIICQCSRLHVRSRPCARVFSVVIEKVGNLVRRLRRRVAPRCFLDDSWDAGCF